LPAGEEAQRQQSERHEEASNIHTGHSVAASGGRAVRRMAWGMEWTAHPPLTRLSIKRHHPYFVKTDPGRKREKRFCRHFLSGDGSHPARLRQKPQILHFFLDTVS
jgi:hypothetical protein